MYIERRSHDQILKARMDARINARIRRDDATITRREKREAAADRYIGELCRGGVEVLYVWPVGRRYREGTRSELANYLMRIGIV